MHLRLVTLTWECGSGDIQVLFHTLPGTGVKLLQRSISTLPGEGLKTYYGIFRGHLVARELQVWWVEVYPTPDGKRVEVFVAWEDERFVIRQLAKTPSVVILYYCSYLVFSHWAEQASITADALRQGCPTFPGKGPQFLLWVGSRVVRVKATHSKWHT